MYLVYDTRICYSHSELIIVSDVDEEPHTTLNENVAITQRLLFSPYIPKEIKNTWMSSVDLKLGWFFFQNGDCEY